MREYPTLCLVALRLLSVCCTSAQDERNASAAGLVIDERRTSLAPERAEELVVARHYLRQQRGQTNSLFRVSRELEIRPGCEFHSSFE